MVLLLRATNNNRVPGLVLPMADKEQPCSLWFYQRTKDTPSVLTEVEVEAAIERIKRGRTTEEEEEFQRKLEEATAPFKTKVTWQTLMQEMN